MGFWPFPAPEAAMRFARKQGIKAVVGDDHAVVPGVVQRGAAKTATDRRPPARQTESHQNSSKAFSSLQQLDGFAHHVATAACPSGGTTGLYAVDATVAFVDHILRPDVLRKWKDRSCRVSMMVGIKKRRPVRVKVLSWLRVTANLQDPAAPAWPGLQRYCSWWWTLPMPPLP